MKNLSQRQRERVANSLSLDFPLSVAKNRKDFRLALASFQFASLVFIQCKFSGPHGQQGSDERRLIKARDREIDSGKR
jgi:hypothetical protein